MFSVESGVGEKAAKSPQGSKVPRVALVDDDDNVHLFLRDLGAFGHYEVIVSCYNAADALGRLPCEHVDVVVMDIRLPDMSGIDCTSKLKTLLPDLPIIILTGYADEQSFLRSLMAGARGFLVKPIKAQEFLNAINDVLKGEFPLAKQVVPFLVQVIHSFRQVTEESQLTDREKEILACVFRRLQDKEIASELGIGIATVHTHVHRLLAKLGVRSRREIIEKYLRLG